MLNLRGDSCYTKKLLVSVYVALACVDVVVALVSFFQLMRIQMRSSQRGWTRQKVFHLLIGSSNMGSFAFFLLIVIRTCKRWLGWSQFCGFIIMVSPKILLLAVFVLLLSFWADLCHQANDEDEEECCLEKTLLEKTPNVSHPVRRKWRECWEFLLFRSSQIRSRQRNVVFFIVGMLILMVASALLIWIESNTDPTVSLVVAQAYIDILTIVNLVVTGGLAWYGILLFSKLKRIRSETSCEMWKVAGVAVVSVTCFTSSSFVALFFTDIPLLHDLAQQQQRSEWCTSVLLMLYHFIGSSLPSAFILWVMKESPPSTVSVKVEDPRVVMFLHGTSAHGSAAVHQTHRWTSATTSQNQVSRGSPI